MLWYVRTVPKWDRREAVYWKHSASFSDSTSWQQAVQSIAKPLVIKFGLLLLNHQLVLLLSGCLSFWLSDWQSFHLEYRTLRLILSSIFRIWYLDTIYNVSISYPIPIYPILINPVKIHRTPAQRAGNILRHRLIYLNKLWNTRNTSLLVIGCTNDYILFGLATQFPCTL